MDVKELKTPGFVLSWVFFKLTHSFLQILLLLFQKTRSQMHIFKANKMYVQYTHKQVHAILQITLGKFLSQAKQIKFVCIVHIRIALPR